jgi:hypothetical protein
MLLIGFQALSSFEQDRDDLYTRKKKKIIKITKYTLFLGNQKKKKKKKKKRLLGSEYYFC